MTLYPFRRITAILLITCISGNLTAGELENSWSDQPLSIVHSYHSIATFQEQALAATAPTFTRHALNISISVLLISLTTLLIPSKSVLLHASTSWAGALLASYKLIHFGVRLFDAVRFSRDVFSKKQTSWPPIRWRTIGSTVFNGWVLAGIGLWVSGSFAIAYSLFGIPSYQKLSGLPPSLTMIMFLRQAINTLYIADQEEIIFRRLLLGSLLKRIKPFKANGIQAVFFALAHFGGSLPGGLEMGLTQTSPSGSFPLFAMGLLYGRAYRKGGYWFGFAAHYLFNLVVIAARWKSMFSKIFIIITLMMGALVPMTHWMIRRRATAA